MNNEWLQNLKVGDEVAIYYSRSFYGRWAFSKVDRETAKYFIVGRVRYRKENGRQAGDGYASKIEEPTAELKAEVAEKQRRQTLQAKLAKTEWHKLPTEILEAAYAATQPPASASALAQKVG